jgi:hypothetical protein
MYDEELEEKIKNYGRLSYNNGFKDGFFIGICMGSVISIISILATKTLCK